MVTFEKSLPQHHCQVPLHVSKRVRNATVNYSECYFSLIFVRLDVEQDSRLETLNSLLPDATHVVRHEAFVTTCLFDFLQAILSWC